jgi:hypothetical protein
MSGGESEISAIRITRNVSFVEPELATSPSSDEAASPKNIGSIHFEEAKNSVLCLKNFVGSKSTLKWFFLVAYNVYLGYAIYYHFDSGPSCHDPVPIS